jgi:hypothetical protein
MRSFTGLKAKLAELIAARRALAARPHVVVYLPRNGREPADAPDGTFTTGTPYATVVHYDPANPPPELAAQAANSHPTAGDGGQGPSNCSENRTETHSQKGTS